MDSEAVVENRLLRGEVSDSPRAPDEDVIPATFRDQPLEVEHSSALVAIAALGLSVIQTLNASASPRCGSQSLAATRQ